MSRRSRLSSLLCLAVALTTTLAVTGPSGSAAPTRGARADAGNRLQADATGSVRLSRDAHGEVSFVGTDAGEPVDNPSVTPGTSVSDAARSHLNRYGAVLGAARPGTTLRQLRATTTAVGDVVRYTQRVRGLPVVGGDVVVSMNADRELVSMLSTMSKQTRVPAARVSAAMAEQAVSIVGSGGSGGAVHVTSQGRWLLDPEVVGPATGLGARGVWRFEVTRGPAWRHDLFIDDQTGAVLLDVNQIQTVNPDRVICDRNSVEDGSSPPCIVAFARVEGQAATDNDDVDHAYDHTGAAVDLYSSLGVDLTALVGRTIAADGNPRLAATVRQCFTGNCPYQNAFWDGEQTYFGTGWPADEIVGHEWTHGVVERNSGLFYWGQSGAMNESMADIMGEIVDHRFATSGDSATDFRIAEDTPMGAFRNMADPTLFNDPPSTQSGFWNHDIHPSSFYVDSGGVHTNSGVGNKTAYLIMEGGSFNSQTVTSIEAPGDDVFAKTAALYLLVIQSLSSGSDYADLGLVLDQACQSLVGTLGFTAANCADVHRAGLATELAQTPFNAAQPPDASKKCPKGYGSRVLFDSETGAPATKFVAAANWQRDIDTVWGPNAHSGSDSWNNVNPFSTATMTPATESLVMSSPVAIPSGQKSYLRFQGWHSLHFTINTTTGAWQDFFDGGTVEVDNVADAAPPVDVASHPWVNGPSTLITSGTANPAAGRTAFVADSLGWVASKLDLAGFAGTSIKPQFSVHYDNARTYIGWFVDDVMIYTCDRLRVIPGKPTIKGDAVVGEKLKARPGGWLPSGVTFKYEWFRDGRKIRGAKDKRYKVGNLDVGHKLFVRVTGSKRDHQSASRGSKKTKRVKAP